MRELSETSDIDRGQFDLVNVFVCHCYFFGFIGLQRVWRCRKTDLVLDKGGVKVSTRNRPLSP